MRAEDSALDALQSDPAYWEEWVLSDFAEDLDQRMKQRGLSRSALADRLGVSPAYVTKALRGDTNFTLRSMVRFAMAVDSVVRVHLAPVGTSTRWFDVVKGMSTAAEAGTEYQKVTFGPSPTLKLINVSRVAIAPLTGQVASG